eukprot:COSAG01_NODE_27701_length_679_cov_0.815517_1_plen_163_part_00
MDAESTMDEDLIEALFANGLMGVEVPEEHGGCGASFTTMCAVIEELAKVDPGARAAYSRPIRHFARLPVLTEIPDVTRGLARVLVTKMREQRTRVAVSTLVDVHSTVVNNTIKFWASEELQARYLPRLAADTVGSFCLSEPGSGSDAFALTTRAELSADGSQ